MTGSPGATPRTTSTRVSPEMPTSTSRRWAWAPSTTRIHGLSSASPRTASAGKMVVWARSATVISTDTVMSGRRYAGGVGTVRRTSMVPRRGSTAGAI